MAITLADMARMKDDKFEQGIIETLIQESDLMSRMEFETIGTVQINARRYNALPSVGFRGRGQRYTEGNVGWDTVSDAVYPLGGEINIDKMDKADKATFENPLEFKTEQVIKSISYTFNYYLISGDHATDVYGFEGIERRVSDLAAAQTVYGISSSAELDVRSAASPSDATLRTFLDRIDDARYQVDGHKADFALTDGDFIRTLKGALRRTNLYVSKAEDMPINIGQRDTSANPLSKAHFMYDGTLFYDMGVQSDQTSKIVSTDTVGGQACRRCYFGRFGRPYLQGIQEYPLETEGPFMLDDGVTHRVVVDWPVGIRHIHPKSFAVLRGVRVA